MIILLGFGKSTIIVTALLITDFLIEVLLLLEQKLEHTYLRTQMSLQEEMLM